MSITLFWCCNACRLNEASLIPSRANGRTRLVYDASVRLRLAILLIVSGALLLINRAGAQEREKPEEPSSKKSVLKSEPKFDSTFSGPIVELSATKITVSRSILGKPAEKRTFWIKSDTRIEGKLRMRAKVTVGFVTTDDGDVARLVVVRTSQRQSQKK
jgi:hypothetical protein